MLISGIELRGTRENLDGPPAQIFVTVLFLGEELASAKTAGKIYNSPSASGGIGVGGGEGGDSLVRFMMCLSEWKRVLCDAMNKERDGKCLFAGRDSSRLRSRASRACLAAFSMLI